MPSQFGQDLFVLETLGGLRNGFFLDSGAADGVSASNTQLLEESFGWRGICVEPNELLLAELLKNRRCRCLNCCLYNREGEVEFLEGAMTLGEIVDEYDPAVLRSAAAALRLPENPDGLPRTVLRPARTVRSVLEECRAPPVIDYWSLDTEGSEFAILKSFPFDSFAFRVLTVEHNWLAAREEIRVFLESRGYFRIRVLDIDDCYARDFGASRVPWRSRAWTRWT
jgi:hypothetical protein